MTVLPRVERPDDDLAGHQLLARLGKRVLRPGGARLSGVLLDTAGVADADVVELAPGTGRTARDILARRPRSYAAVDNDPAAAAAVSEVVGRAVGASSQVPRRVVVADAAASGLPDGCADVVVGEAMLTMQGDRTKDAIVAEAVRLLRPGGRYAVHELGLVPDDVADTVRTEVRRALARAIKVNARPLTVAEWEALMSRHGLEVEHVALAPMALLRPRRVLADEGLVGALRLVRNIAVRPAARRRVLAMRRTFRTHRRAMTAVAVVARKPG
ncbi:methyltransferase [Pseudonocardia sulfidoxydans NBRC 16205]|uniref:Methyltransferase n=1 Tax=Pseudonocardia sulfidoxydans NBRC 16205 TaxID=1223511 RepID=A0A511DI15_9PSEU|nr:methyltransferase domain-containing protein [Pseudonocardia sulfidoxydans]GEL23973.1 methyltransferase [Pseudonocardia sulfidoxydans NBRC 16205]